jgi:hypothetical protein
MLSMFNNSSNTTTSTHNAALHFPLAQHAVLEKKTLLKPCRISNASCTELTFDKERPCQGGQCDSMSARGSMTLQKSLTELEPQAIASESGSAAIKGEQCRKVTADRGIYIATFQTLSERLNLEKALGEVMLGKNVAKVAEQFGIKTFRTELECFSVMSLDDENPVLRLGPAGLAAYRGGNCQQIAELYGLIDEKPRQWLEMVSVKYVVVREILQGVSRQTVINKYGIKTKWIIEKLETIHKSPWGFVYQPNRAKRLFQSGTMGWVHDQLNKRIYKCSISLIRCVLSNHPLGGLNGEGRRTLAIVPGRQPIAKDGIN